MAVERLHSLREPRIWVYFGLSAGLALVAGIGLEFAVRELLRELSDLDAGSSDAVALRSAAWLTGLATFFCVLCACLGASLFQAFRLAVSQQRMPPTGVWSLGAVRIVTGRQAVVLGRIGMGLAIAMGLCGVALGFSALWFVWYVLGCAAKNL